MMLIVIDSTHVREGVVTYHTHTHTYTHTRTHTHTHTLDQICIQLELRVSHSLHWLAYYRLVWFGYLPFLFIYWFIFLILFMIWPAGTGKCTCGSVYAGSTWTRSWKHNYQSINTQPKNLEAVADLSPVCNSTVLHAVILFAGLWMSWHFKWHTFICTSLCVSHKD